MWTYIKTKSHSHEFWHKCFNSCCHSQLGEIVANSIKPRVSVDTVMAEVGMTRVLVWLFMNVSGNPLLLIAATPQPMQHNTLQPSKPEYYKELETNINDDLYRLRLKNILIQISWVSMFQSMSLC